MHAVQKTNAATKCNRQAKLYTTDFYRFLPLALTRASYSQTCSDTNACGTAAQRDQNAPYFSPDIKVSLWNTALLSIEQINYLLQAIGVHGDYIGTATLHLPRLLYASSKTTRSSGKPSSSGTTTMVVNSTP